MYKNKRNFVLGVFMLLSSISHIHSVSAQTIYISQHGNDNNSGLSMLKPWKTLKKIEPGYTYLFQRGDTFYCSIPKLYNINKSKRITLAAYGIGKKPVLSLYKRIRPESWEKFKENVWRVNISNLNNTTGYQSVSDNVGFINIDGVIEGNRFITLDAINTQWQFNVQGGYLYVFSDANPATLKKEIRVANEGPIIALSDFMVVRDLRLIGSGGHAVQGADVKNVTLANLEITEIGGSYLAGHEPGTRYGNGVEFWNSALNCVVTDCNVSQVYDVAFTMQGNGDHVYFNNVVFDRNIARDNEQTFEFWILGNKSGFKRCKFVNNKGYDAGGGWSHTIRPDRSVGVHILNYSWDVDENASDLLIASNTFEGAVSGYMSINSLRPGKSLFKSQNNSVVLASGVPIEVNHGGEFKEDFIKFKAETKLETNSKLILRN